MRRGSGGMEPAGMRNGWPRLWPVRESTPPWRSVSTRPFTRTHGTSGPRIEAFFAGLSDTLKGLLIAAVPDPSQDRAILGMRYQAKSVENPRGKASFWAGKFDTSTPEAGSTDLIRHVYLQPLRDARQGTANRGCGDTDGHHDADAGGVGTAGTARVGAARGDGAGDVVGVGGVKSSRGNAGHQRNLRRCPGNCVP